jgi:hypothetical protein
MELDTYKKAELVIKALTLFGALIAAIWAYHPYTDTKEKGSILSSGMQS